MIVDIPLFGTEEFSRMTSPVNSETIQLPTPEWSSSEVSPDLKQVLGLGEDLLGLEPRSRSCVQESRPCNCPSRALQQQEDVCINLHWAARGINSVLPAEMLQCLKRVMEAYDELLECRSHPAEPERISLLMSTFDMMVAGAEHLVVKTVGHRGEDDSSERSRRSYFQEKPRFKTAERPNMAGTVKSQRPSHHYGQLVLDEEDERCVLQSLLAVRSRRLSLLVERLHQAADRDGRPVHIRLAHNFRERCKVILSSLES